MKKTGREAAKPNVGASFRPGYKQLAAAVAETGVDDYREIVKKVKKTGELEDCDRITLRELDRDMPKWLGHLDVDMTWDDIKDAVRRAELC